MLAGAPPSLPSPPSPPPRQQGRTGGLARGAVHEWFGLALGAASTDPGSGPRSRSRRRGPAPASWIPPLGVLAHLALRAAHEPAMSGGLIAWIGRRAWTHPCVLAGFGAPRPAMGPRALFIDAPDAAARVWAIDLALRSPAVAMVIADGSGIDMASSRRLQLAAEAGRRAGGGHGGSGGGGGVALLARPIEELSELSAAATRWRVAPEPSPGRSPRWSIQLLRCKGGGVGVNSAARWVLEWDRGPGTEHPSSSSPSPCRVVAPAAVVDRPGAAEVAA